MADHAESAATFVAELSDIERQRLLALVHSDRARLAEALKARGVSKIGVRLKVELLLKEEAGPYHGFDAVPMKALVSTTSEPARAQAVDLVIIGNLLSSRLARDGVCDPTADFARVWRDHVVPIAASRVTTWRMGMCAEVTGLTSAAGTAFNNVVGRIESRSGNGNLSLTFRFPFCLMLMTSIV